MNTDHSCIFCSIISKKIPAKIIAENDRVIVIEDNAPKAPVHYLIIPKKHIAAISTLQQDDASIGSDIFLMAQQLSKELPGLDAFRLLINNGADAGQSIPHVHCHFVSGKIMSDF